MAKETLEEHRKWLDKQVPDEPLRVAQTRYESASSLALLNLQESPFWRALTAELAELDDQYFRSTSGFKLFATADSPRLVRKSFDSLVEKTYRKNVLLNANWPDPPPDGWITPANWLTRISDIVRTTFVVKYLDGVQFLVSSMRDLCAELDLVYDVDFEARAEGYYAAHSYVEQKVEVPKRDWDTEVIEMALEVQITTQLQEAIRQLTHVDYVQRRASAPPAEKWQWNHRDPHFITNYLGHILHYVEGMIMEVRDRRSSP